MTTEGKTIEDRIDKASYQLDAVKKHANAVGQYSDAIHAAQLCVNLSVKAILSLLDIDFSPSHEWEPTKQAFSDIARQIQERNLRTELANQNLGNATRLPRLLFLVNFWARLYIPRNTVSKTATLHQLKSCLKKKKLVSP